MIRLLITIGMGLMAFGCPGQGFPAGRLDDANRIDFLSTRILSSIHSNGSTHANLDSAEIYTRLLEPLVPNVRSKRVIRRAYEAFAEYYLAAKKRKQADSLALQYFQDVHRSGNIVAESIYVNELTLLTMDTRLVPTMVSMMDQLWADDERVLPHAADADQRVAINQLGEAAIMFIYIKRPDLVFRFDSMAILLNERFHQRATWPYQNLSFLYTLQGRTREALTVAFEAIRIAESAAESDDGAGYESAARVYFMTGDFDKCLEYTNRALALFFKNPFAVEYPGALMYRTVQILKQRRKPGEALHLVQLISTTPLYWEVPERDYAYLAVAAAECFHALGQNDSAEQYYKKALGMVLMPGYSNARQYFKIVPYNSMAAFYIATRQYVRASDILDSLSTIDTRGMVVATYFETFWLLRYQVDSALGNYLRAMSELRQYQKLHDSLTNVTRIRQLDEMNVQYETDKKNQHIVDLEKQNSLQARLQQVMLRQEHIVRDSLIACAVLLALLAAGLYRRYRHRQRTNQQLEELSHRQQRLIGEKEWLVKEIHHRVKNNLHMISGLLDGQAGFLKTGEAVSAIRESQHRVNAMSLVHQKLYQTGNLSMTDMSAYIRELVAYLEASFDCSSRIHFNLQVERLQFGLSHTIPLCLILNEAITNAIKYAFPDGRKGEITIRLQHGTDDRFILSIADDGLGLPAGGISGRADSMGMNLMRGLSEDIGGNFFIDGSRGTMITVVFEGK